jgi:hypothetical protein
VAGQLVVTILAAVADRVFVRPNAKRVAGFWLFLLSNILWAAWGLANARAYALVGIADRIGHSRIFAVFTQT